MQKFDFDVGVWFGPHDFRSQGFTVLDDSLALAELTVIDWVMSSGRDSKRSKKPKNVGWLTLLAVDGQKV